MKPQITVVDENGNRVGVTFTRRAAQLVGKGKARWLDGAHTVICLSPAGSKEENDMEMVGKEMFETADNGQRHAGAPKKADGAGYSVVEAPPLAEGELYKMAKERIQERFALLMHWAVFIAAQLLFILLASMGVVEDLILLVDGIWFAAICLHTVYYFIKITPAKIEREYHKLLMKRR